MKHGLEVT